MRASETAEFSRDGFRGYLYNPDIPSDRCIMVLIGDDGNDFMDQACARWLTRYQKIRALCIALRKSKKMDSGVDLWPLETIQNAVRWLHARGIQKVGILGMSVQAAAVLSASARIPDLSLVIAFSPCDFVPWGFQHRKILKDQNAEYPTGNSAFTWNGVPLPFQPAGQSPEEYWERYKNDTHKYHEPHSKRIFEYSEAAAPVSEDARIPAENIRGAVVLIGAEDDSMWDSPRYIHRLRARMNEKEFIFPLKTYIYPRGTHLLVPQRMLMGALPFIGSWVYLAFASGRSHRKECREARLHLDRHLTGFLQNW